MSEFHWSARLEKYECATQGAQKGQTSHRPTPAVISPTRPESAKTASSPRDAPSPKHACLDQVENTPAGCSKRLSSKAAARTFQFLIPHLRGGAEAALYCAHRATTAP